MIFQENKGPIVAAAIHAAHAMRPEVVEYHGLSEKQRLREEDPYTDQWTREVGDFRIIGEKSRFEYDINRPRHKAVYLTPDDAWDLSIWETEPPRELIDRSLKEYDEFYEEVRKNLDNIRDEFGRFVVLDIHSYNHIRPGPDSPPADAEKNPEVIVGTSNMDQSKWTPLIEKFISDLRSSTIAGRHPDVRKNVKWTGGHFSEWIHNTYPDHACCFAIEFKKLFMNEWTGEIDPEHHDDIHKALKNTVPGLREKLSELNAKDQNGNS